MQQFAFAAPKPELMCRTLAVALLWSWQAKSERPKGPLQPTNVEHYVGEGSRARGTQVSGQARTSQRPCLSSLCLPESEADPEMRLRFNEVLSATKTPSRIGLRPERQAKTALDCVPVILVEEEQV
jgi:hypothetical protein